MRILTISWLPLDPVDSGYKRRLVELYGALSERAEVLVLAPGEASPGLPARALGPFGRSLRFAPKSHVLRPLLPRFRRRVARAAAGHRPDLIVAEGLWAAPAALAAGKRLGVPTGIAATNLEFRSAEGVYPSPVIAALRRRERKTYRSADFLLGTSPSEAEELTALVAPEVRDVFLASNGGRIPPSPTDEEVRAFRQRTSIRPEERVVLFVGRLDYPPNARGLEWFAREVLPSLEPRGDRIRWLVVGSPLPTSPLPPFEFLGFVPDLGPVLAAADLCIAPVRHGSGTSVKALEYFAAGRPVAATSHALRGLNSVPGVHAAVGDSPGQFAEAVDSLLDRPGAAERMGREARALVERDWTWAAIADRLTVDLETFLGSLRTDRRGSKPL